MSMQNHEATSLGRMFLWGGILLGAARPVHIMTTSSTVRRIVDMTAVAAADASAERAARP